MLNNLPRAGGGRGQAPQPPSLFLKETWKEAPGNVPVTQAFVVNPDLQLTLYGTGKEDFGVTSEGNVPHRIARAMSLIPPWDSDMCSC